MEREFVEFVYNWVLGQLRINACLCQRLKLDSGRSAWLWTRGRVADAERCPVMIWGVQQHMPTCATALGILAAELTTGSSNAPKCSIFQLFLSC